jgi:hypothetical protein
MPATLSEAFGQNYDTYPPSEVQQKRKKKNAKGKTYGQEVPQRKFTSPEPKKELNLTIGGYPEEDDQYLSISTNNEYGPTDYNIKPKDVEEYMLQMNKNYVDTNTNTNIINRTLVKPSISSNQDPNMVDESSDDESEKSMKQDKSKARNSFNNVRNGSGSEEVDPRIADFNAKLDLILEKLGHMDEPVQENIHDIILFVILEYQERLFVNFLLMFSY